MKIRNIPLRKNGQPLKTSPLKGKPLSSWNFAIGLVLVMGSVGIDANERHFTYNYETAVLAPGEREIEVSNTLGLGKSSYYANLDHRLEFETGVADNVMTAFYLNWSQTTTEGPTSATLASQFAWKGISNEWKWKLLDPVADPIGLALYGEVGYNTDALDLEPKLILDKRIGPWMLVANLIMEFEFEATADEMKLHEIAPQLTLGMAYEVEPGFHTGLEFRQENVVERPSEGEDFEMIISSLFLGPNVSYSTKNWWVSFTVMPQLPALITESGGSILDLNDHDKLDARLLFSFHI